MDARRVVSVINQGRVVLGFSRLRKMKTGVPYDLFLCPLARALDAYIDHQNDASWIAVKGVKRQKALAKVWGTEVNSGWVQLPEILHEFMRAFDAGKVPELSEVEIVPRKTVKGAMGII